MKNRAVIYARFSCEKQTEQSIEGQIRVCNEFAKRNGYTIVHQYIDRATSGKTDHRKEFQEMIKDSAKGGFDFVLVYKLDRFARNRYDSAMNKALLKKNGVRVLSACEHITDSPEGIILEAMIEGYAEYYSADLAQKVSRGMRESSIKGQYTGGFVLFGYKVANKKLYIDETESQIVWKIFNDFLNGKQIKDIVLWLNESGIRTHSGAKFHISRVSSMLRNEKYIGKCVIKGQVYDNIYPRIITDDVFQTVQERLALNERSANRVRAYEEFLLTGKLFCAHCGDMITGDNGTSHTGTKYFYYKCASKKKNARACESRAFHKDLLEDSIYRQILQTMRNPDYLDKVAVEVVEEYNANIEKSLDLTMYQTQLKEVERKIENLMNAICDGFYNANSQQKMLELNETKDKLLSLIAQEERKEKKELSIAEVKKFLRGYEKYTDGSMESKKRLFDLFVKEVIFDGKNVLIVLRTYKGAEVTKALQENSLVNPRKAGRTNEYGEGLTLEENGVKKVLNQTCKRFSLELFGDPYGTRTHVTTVKGWCLNRLTMGPSSLYCKRVRVDLSW